MFQVCGEAAVEDREWIKLGAGGGCGGRHEGMKVGGGSSRGGREGRGVRLQKELSRSHGEHGVLATD